MVSTSYEYARQIESVLHTRIDFRVDQGGTQLRGDLTSPDWDSPQEARTALAEMRLRIKQLRDIKRDISLTMKETRSGYQAQKTTVEAGFWASLAGKKAAGQERARKKELLRIQQENELRPYTVLVQFIDKAIMHMEARKLDAQKEIDAAKR